jgi:hypothetical protein
MIVDPRFTLINTLMSDTSATGLGIHILQRLEKAL